MKCDYRLLQEQYILLRKELFGKKSEKQTIEDSEQVTLDELLAEVAEQSEPPKPLEPDQDFVKVPAHNRRRKHPGRNAIPEDIPVVYHRIEPSEQEMECCGTRKAKIGEEIRKVVERIPARYELHIYIRPKYACQKCKDGVTVAEPPLVSPIPKGIAGLRLMIFVMLSKYHYHLPLYRIQRQIYHESRIWFTRSTMVGWIREFCVPLERVVREMIVALKKGPYIHADESPVRRVGDETGPFKAYMWVYVGADDRIAIFDYKESRGSDAPKSFLQDTPSGTYLMTDAYASYNQSIDKYNLIAMICMVHLRREFIEAADVGVQKAYALRIIRIIGQLYRIERFATKKELSHEERLALRKNYSAKIMEKLKVELLNPGFALLPSSRIGKAIAYALNHWEKAMRFLEAGYLPIDNNLCERVIRLLAIGRKNWISIMSEDGGKRMAILYSIIMTCKLNNIDPEEYLADVLMRLAVRPMNMSVADLTPVEWLKAKNGGKLPKQTPLYPNER